MCEFLFKLDLFQTYLCIYNKALAFFQLMSFVTCASILTGNE